MLSKIRVVIIFFPFFERTFWSVSIGPGLYGVFLSSPNGESNSPSPSSMGPLSSGYILG